MSSLVKRMIQESWMEWLPAVSFLLVFLVFAFAVVRALAASRANIDYLAALPISDEKGEDNV